MGDLARAQRSHTGPKISGLDAAALTAELVIFMGPVFDPSQHRVRNWSVAPGEQRGFAGSKDFPGLDRLGWGLSPNGVITCINMPLCKHFEDVPPQSWATLWDLESSLMERTIAIRSEIEAHRKLLERLIVFVTLEDLGFGFVPDPAVWNVSVSLNRSQTSVSDGTFGKLELKSKINTDTERVRNSKFTFREPWPNFGGKEPWQTK